MSARYARVSNDDNQLGLDQDNLSPIGATAAENILQASGGIRSERISTTRAERRRKRAERAEYYSTKLHAALWILGATLATYFTDFFNVCLNSKTVNRFWFNLGILCFTITTILILYMAVWVPRVLKITYEPSVYSPRLLPITGGTCIGSGFFFIIGLWPVYGFFTPGLLLLIFIGALMSAHFLPAI